MSSSFRTILQQVTQEKLEELKVQKELMNNHFLPVLERCSTETSKCSSTLKLLYDAVNTSPVKDTFQGILIENLKYLLQNSQDDPSLGGRQLLTVWISRIKQEITYALRKCEYSYLYGSLLSEWLELEEQRQGPQRTGGGLDNSQLKRDEAISKFREMMFIPPTKEEFEGPKFHKFLKDELFSFGEDVDSSDKIDSIIKETKTSFDFAERVIYSTDVKACIQGLRSEALLSEDKKEALKELHENEEAVEEVAALLTSRLRNLQRWEWPSQSQTCEVRRGLAGEYKPFMKEDIITALFLQYVGVQWGAYFKGQFLRIYQSKMWVKLDCIPNSIETQRVEFHQGAFLSSLPDSMLSQESKHQEEYAKVESFNDAMNNDLVVGASQSMVFCRGAPPPQQPLMKRMARSVKMYAPVPPMPPRKPKSDLDFKQAFLHVLCTEIRLHQAIRVDKPLIVVQADLETFGPSIIHDAVLIALEYLGVPREWLDFFKKFLQPSLKFEEGDAEKRVVRGVPTSHSLSNFFGETLLFLLDFSVNRKCNGTRLYRISDEFWFWGHNQSDVLRAWETLNMFGKMVGLKIQENRSGSTVVLSEEQLVTATATAGQSQGQERNAALFYGPAPLPQRNIHWGYLQLASSGTFIIDQKSIGKFLTEMKELLEKSECVLEWINIFNKYLAFFVRNFGKSAVVSGKQHQDQIVAALRMIYAGIFGKIEEESPVETLKRKFTKIKDEDIIDAWVYWPLDRGGLGLINPFIGILALREAFTDMEEEVDFKKLPLKDKLLYEEKKKEHDKRYYDPYHPAPISQIPKLPSWEDYLASRETELWHWTQKYLRLLEQIEPKTPSVTDQYYSLDSSKTDEERVLDMWLFSYYETQLIMHFGNVKFINSKLLPMSMISSIQKSKVKH